MLVETDTAQVHVTDVKTGLVLEEDTIIQKLILLIVDVHIQSALVVFIVVVQESVQVVADVTPM